MNSNNNVPLIHEATSIGELSIRNVHANESSGSNGSVNLSPPPPKIQQKTNKQTKRMRRDVQEYERPVVRTTMNISRRRPSGRTRTNEWPSRRRRHSSTLRWPRTRAKVKRRTNEKKRPPHPPPSSILWDGNDVRVRRVRVAATAIRCRSIKIHQSGRKQRE